MKKIIISKYGAPEVLQVRDTEIPIPKSGEILIKNYFILNNKKLTTIEIEGLYIKSENIKKTQIIDFLINFCVDNSISLLGCVEELNNRYFIDTYDFKKSIDMYYHMYNFHSKKIKSCDISFNL